MVIFWLKKAWQPELSDIDYQLAEWKIPAKAKKGRMIWTKDFLKKIDFWLDLAIIYRILAVCRQIFEADFFMARR